MKTAVRICFVQTLQRVKVNRCLESNEDSINPQPGSKQNSFSNFAAESLVKRAKNSERCEIFQRNGSETTSTGIAPAASGASAFRVVPALLKPRFT